MHVDRVDGASALVVQAGGDEGENHFKERQVALTMCDGEPDLVWESGRGVTLRQSGRAETPGWGNLTKIEYYGLGGLLGLQIKGHDSFQKLGKSMKTQRLFV
jgi:hypothetical protein